MSLREHLREARNRLAIIAIAVILGTVAGWFLSDFILLAMRSPVVAMATPGQRLAGLNYGSVGGAFDLKIQIAITVGIVVSSPVWLYEIFAFITPGLTRKEKRYAFGFLFAAVPLFLAGCASGWFVLPHIVGLLIGIAPVGDSSLIDAKGYYDFVLKLVLIVGVAFIIPVFLVALNFLGLVSAQSLMKSWRTALISIVLFTAVATPSADVVSMFLLAVPMMLLYVGAIGVAMLHDRGERKRSERLLASSAEPA